MSDPVTLALPGWFAPALMAHGAVSIALGVILLALRKRQAAETSPTAQYPALPALAPVQVVKEQHTGRWTAAQAPTAVYDRGSVMDPLEPKPRCLLCKQAITRGAPHAPD